MERVEVEDIHDQEKRMEKDFEVKKQNSWSVGKEEMKYISD